VVQEEVTAIGDFATVFSSNVSNPPNLAVVVVDQELHCKPIGIATAFAHLAEAFKCLQRGFRTGAFGHCVIIGRMVGDKSPLRSLTLIVN
jgi:hypothetical protein